MKWREQLKHWLNPDPPREPETPDEWRAEQRRAAFRGHRHRNVGGVVGLVLMAVGAALWIHLGAGLLLAGGLILAMPSRKGMDDKYHDYAHPINNKYREWLERTIVKKYLEMRDKGEFDAEKKAN